VLISAGRDEAHVRQALPCGVLGDLTTPCHADQRSERVRRIVAQLDGAVAAGEAADASAAS
jgi:response regulator of citrate/malate metabolism